MSPMLAILVTLFLLIANAFFVGAEFALISARRTQVEPRAESGSRAAKTTLKAMENVTHMLAGAQLGVTVCSLALGAISEPAIAHWIEPVLQNLNISTAWLHPISFVIALSIIMFLHVVFGEMVPKSLALAKPETSAVILGPPMYYIVQAIKPLIIAFNAIANGCLRLIRVQPADEVSSTFTREQVVGMVEESRNEGLLDSDAYVLLAGAIDLLDQTTAGIMIPMDQLVTVNHEQTVSDVSNIAARTGFSRFPVSDSDGGLLGYIHLKDVLETDPEKTNRPLAHKWVRPLPAVTPDHTLKGALEVMRSRGSHLAQVVDSEGTTFGIVMLEDVLEKLVGEIRDATQQLNA